MAVFTMQVRSTNEYSPNIEIAQIIQFLSFFNAAYLVVVFVSPPFTPALLHLQLSRSQHI